MQEAGPRRTHDRRSSEYAEKKRIKLRRCTVPDCFGGVKVFVQTVIDVVGREFRRTVCARCVWCVHDAPRLMQSPAAMSASSSMAPLFLP
jgi:hypothetical protein